MKIFECLLISLISLTPNISLTQTIKNQPAHLYDVEHCSVFIDSIRKNQNEGMAKRCIRFALSIQENSLNFHFDTEYTEEYQSSFSFVTDQSKTINGEWDIYQINSAFILDRGTIDGILFGKGECRINNKRGLVNCVFQNAENTISFDALAVLK